MQQQTVRQLYAYWDTIRNGRIAPQRSEIEPSRIANLLCETFIVERRGPLHFRFRLAGTRICDQFGRELRGADVLSLWSNEDRGALASLLRSIVDDGAVGNGTFSARTGTGRQAAFEIVLLPVINRGAAIDRILGAVTAIEPPFWLGTEPLSTFEITDLEVRRRNETHFLSVLPGLKAVRGRQRRFRVIEGGLSKTG